MREFEKGINEENFDEIEITEGDEGKRFTGILRKILLTPREAKHSQKHVIFRTRCTINKRVCDVIVVEAVKMLCSRVW